MNIAMDGVEIEAALCLLQGLDNLILTELAFAHRGPPRA